MSDKFPKVAGGPTVPDAFNGEIYKSVGKYARSAVLYAFDQMGGPDSLSKWAEKNPDEFYTKLFPKIIARESEVTHHKTVDQLMDVIDGDYQVDGDFDDVPDITDELPAIGQGQVYATDKIAPIAHNWNAGDADFDDQDILSEAATEIDGYDPLDDVEFES